MPNQKFDPAIAQALSVNAAIVFEVLIDGMDSLHKLDFVLEKDPEFIRPTCREEYSYDNAETYYDLRDMARDVPYLDGKTVEDAVVEIIRAGYLVRDNRCSPFLRPGLNYPYFCAKGER